MTAIGYRKSVRGIYEEGINVNASVREASWRSEV